MRVIPLLLAIALFPLAACSGKEASADEIRPVTIWWFQWPPATGLQELGQEFHEETGIEVLVRQIPLDSYQDQVFREFGSNETKFDVVIGDSPLQSWPTCSLSCLRARANLLPKIAASRAGTAQHRQSRAGKSSYRRGASAAAILREPFWFQWPP